MKRVIIVQARTGSSRLPAKVLKDLAGRPMLSQQLIRLKRCRRVHELVVATTTNASDDPVVALAKREDVCWFRGSEEDVLARYLGAARQAQGDILIRVTADCPLIDPELTDRVIEELENNSSECDYAANVLERTFPRGLDIEVFFRDVLERMHRLATSRAAREHVTYYLQREHPELFRKRSVTDFENNSDLRWTVDTEDDLDTVRCIYDALNLSANVVAYRDVLAYVRAHPRIAALNQHVLQKHV